MKPTYQVSFKFGCFAVIVYRIIFEASFPSLVVDFVYAFKIGLYLLSSYSNSILILNPALRILIASNIPAHLSYLQASHESNIFGENLELGFMHLTYRGADFFSTKIKLFSYDRN